MSQKESVTLICRECESEYKLVYQLDKTSGFQKICPFCGAEYSDVDEENLDEFN